METPWFSAIPRSANRDLIDRFVARSWRRPAIPCFSRSMASRTVWKAVSSARPAFGACPAPPQSYETPAPEMAQDLTDSLFRSFDGALREMGLVIRASEAHENIAEAFLAGRGYDRHLMAARRGLLRARAKCLRWRGNPDRLARYVEAPTKLGQCLA